MVRNWERLASLTLSFMVKQVLERASLPAEKPSQLLPTNVFPHTNNALLFAFLHIMHEEDNI